MKEVKERPPERRWQLSRRKFLIGMGTVGVLAVGGKLGLDRGRMALANFEGDSGFGAPKGDPDLWLELHADNHIDLYVPKGEFGQGIHTTIAQLVAEELEADWSQLRIIQANTQRGFAPMAMMVFGSTSTSALFKPAREAAATMRQMLIERAALQWDIEPAYVFAMNGEVRSQVNSRQKLSYGEIVATVGEWQAPEVVPTLKSRREFHTIGRSVVRVDLPDKITGQARYGFDMKLEGMLYGAVARPPRFGASLRAADASAASEMPGVVQAVIDLDHDFAGVVAERRTQARRAVDALKLTWEDGITWDDVEVEAAVTVDERKGVVVRNRGNARRALRSGTLVEASYRTPLGAHAQLEPQAALVHVQDGKVDAWVSTQAPDAEPIARAADVSVRHVTLQPTYMGGAFGRKYGEDVAVEATRLSKAAGRAVHVAWDREEEMRNGFFRPPTHNILRASIKDGRIQALEQQNASGDVFVGNGLPDIVGRVVGYDFGATGGVLSFYDVPHQRAKFQRVPLPVPTGSWRGLGGFPNGFAVESFMDELAVAAKRNALEFRLAHLADDPKSVRMKGALEAVAELSSWDATAKGTGQGLACAFYGDTAVAQVAEVALSAGQLRMVRFYCAIDCGLVVNPNGALAQAQGSIVMGLSATLKERITLKGGMVEARNFDRYPLLTIAETPRIDVVFVGKGPEPYGMGEPVICPVAAAVANAAYALTGQRLRTLPLQLEA